MITDWDDAYDNRGHIENAESYPARWASEAQAFRNGAVQSDRCVLDLAYGGGERERLDLFYPEGEPKGLVIFAHGGYWKAFDKSYWSHLAQGPVASGWAVCIPSYTLAPEARISQITQQFGRAAELAESRIEGPIMLTGHSAGGHLVCRMISETTPLKENVTRRIERVISISGVHDLRPLLQTQMNETLRLDEKEAAAESPALLRPLAGPAVLCWVGAEERPEFLRQNDLLVNIWTGLGALIHGVHAPERHHFSVVEDLADPSSELTKALASGA